MCGELNPKTYLIHISNLFHNYSNKNPYVFYIHEDSYESACDWIDFIFDGINTKPARRRLVDTPEIGKIGNSDQISIIDCDSFPTFIWKNGKRVSVHSPIGVNRRTKFEVESNLMNIFNNLKIEYASLIGNVKYFGEIDELEKCTLAKDRAIFILRWMGNIFDEWYKYQHNNLS